MPSHHIHLVLNAIQKSALCRLTLRHRILRRMGIAIADGATVRAGVDFRRGAITIGAGAFVNEGCLFDPGHAEGGIHLGEGAHIGHRTMLIAISHEMGPGRLRAGPAASRPITIGRGAWIGAGVIVMPGVRIGNGAVIGAGAVVTRDCAADTVAAGIPARALRTLDPSDEDMAA